MPFGYRKVGAKGTAKLEHVSWEVKRRLGVVLVPGVQVDIFEQRGVLDAEDYRNLPLHRT